MRHAKAAAHRIDGDRDIRILQTQGQQFLRRDCLDVGLGQRVLKLQRA